MILKLVGVFVGSYLVGSISFSLLAAKKFAGVDLRQYGSGNLGATNAGRLLGRKWAIGIYALDMIKGFLPTFVVMRIFGEEGTVPAPFVAGLATVLGHVFPFYLNFKGGKGVATASGVLLALHPLSAALAIASWTAFLFAFRWVSLASILAAASLPVLFWFLAPRDEGFAWRMGLFAGVALLVIAMHRSNIVKLLAGTEDKIGRER